MYCLSSTLSYLCDFLPRPVDRPDPVVGPYSRLLITGAEPSLPRPAQTATVTLRENRRRRTVPPEQHRLFHHVYVGTCAAAAVNTLCEG